MIILFYPNATHILQPCDVGVFGAFKSVYAKEVQSWKIEKKNREISVVDIVKILKRVQDKMINPATIINAFRATGIFPLNAENCHIERCLPKKSSALASITAQNETSTSQAGEITLFLDDFLFDDSLDSTITNSSLQSTGSTNILEILRDCSNTIGKLGSALKTSNPELLSNVIIMQQQTVLINQKIQNSSIVASPRDSIAVQSTSKHISSPLPSFSKVTEIRQILAVPQPFVRAGKRRNYKIKNHGVMTSDVIMEQYVTNEDAKKKKTEDMEEKKKIREEKKLQAETLRNMKKEKKVENDEKKRKVHAEILTTSTKRTRRTQLR